VLYTASHVKTETKPTLGRQEEHCKPDYGNTNVMLDHHHCSCLPCSQPATSGQHWNSRSGTAVPQEESKRGHTHTTHSQLQPRRGPTTQPDLEWYIALALFVLRCL